MKLQRYARPVRKLRRKPLLLGSILLAILVVSVAASIHHVFRYMKSLENKVLALEKQTQIQQVYEVSGRLQKTHVIKKRSQETSATTWPMIGTTYIRWGRRNCPNIDGTQLVYEGSDFLCLHSNVTYTEGHYVEGRQATAFVYGVEYRDSSASYALFDLKYIEEGVLQYQAVPCAVCLARSTNQLMIPSREDCPDGWTKEYTGYIMTGGYSDTKHSSNHICVDDTPQAIPGTQGDQKGAFLYVAEIDCGYNTPCEPYVDGREIRCVVCSYQKLDIQM